MNRSEIRLGDKVRDTITGYTGIAIAFTEWLNGCIRVTIQAPIDKDGKPLDPYTFDIEQIEVLQPVDESRVVTQTGGPYPEPSRAPNPTR